jgi:hypothetical protein
MSKEVKFKKIGEVEQAQIDGWKAQFDILEVVYIEVNQEGTEDISVVYLKPADRDVLTQVISRGNAGQIVEAGECALVNCWLAGDDRIRNPKGLRQERTAVRAAQLAFGAVGLPEGYVGTKK